jgi:hypothetical protein
MFRSGFKFVMLLLATVVVLGGISLPSTALAQGDSETTPGPVAFISGSNRIMVHQTQVAGNGVDYGLTAPAVTAGTAWVVSILDVTNFGTAPKTLSLGEFQMLLTGGVDAVTADLSQGPSSHFAFADVQADGSVTIPIDATIRVALAFAVPSEALTNESTFPEEPMLKLGDEQANVSSTVVQSLDPAAVPPVQPWTGSQGVVQSVSGNGTIEVNVAGSMQTVELAGVTTPPAAGCFGAESAAAITSLSSGSVWIEDDPNSEGSLIWYWDANRGHLSLMNQALVEQGFGVSDNETNETPYAAWLAAKTEVAETSETGLWSTCKGADGEWINPPTPTPVPTKTADEVRGEYTWPDVRDLVIRPQQFEGEKIAFQGEVFNIPPGQGGAFEFQVWVTTPTGETEAVYVYFEGDSTGIYEGTFVTVYGVGEGYVTGTNAYGGEIVQPLVRAEILDH